MNKLIYFSLSMLFLMTSCITQQKTTRYTIASREGDCVGVAPQKCMLVKKGDKSDWEFFYGQIEGFNYQEGNEYVIEVKEEKKENVPADASSIKYIFVKEISKTAKVSDNLPQPKMQGYQCVGRVLSVEADDIGRGGAAGKKSVTVVKLEVTSITNNKSKEGDIIYCELIPSPKVMPTVGREYVFKAKLMHPAHAKGVYWLETDVMDLVN